MQTIIRRHRKLSLINLLLVSSISLMMIVAYQFNLLFLKNIFVGKQLSNPVTALCLLISAAALFCLSKHSKSMNELGKMLAMLVFITGAFRFIESFFKYNSGIDRWLYTDKLQQFGNMNQPNFMAPNTALLFAITGSALFFYNFKKENKNLITDILAFTVCVLSFICIIGYVYNSTALYKVKTSIPMAFPTALSFFLLSTAIMLKRSAFGFFSLFTRKYLGSKIARFLIPFAIIVPIVGGYIQVFGENRGLYTTSTGEAIFDTINVLILIFLIWRCCIYVNKENKAFNMELHKRIAAEEQTKLNEEFLSALIDNLPEMVFVKNENLQFVRVNRTTEQTVGICREALIGKTDYDFFPKEQADHFVKKDREVFRSNKIVTIPEEQISTSYGLRWLHTKKIIVNAPGGQRFLIGISTDITERKRINEQLQEFNRDLEKKVSERTKELNLKEEEKRMLEKSLMEEKLSQQKKLMEATIDGQENEKKQIGMELHDNINQVLASTKLCLELAGSNKNITMDMVDKSKEYVNYAIKEIRSLSKSLVPHGIETGGLREGITEIIETFQQSTGIKFIARIADPILDKLDARQQIAIYRIIQEQFNNIIKHAHARNIYITLESVKDEVILKIEDDGVGFDMNKKSHGIGLSNIKSRMQLLNGEMNIESSPNNGCKLIITFKITL